MSEIFGTALEGGDKYSAIKVSLSAAQQWIAPAQPDPPKDDKTWAWQTPQLDERVAKESFAKEPEKVDYAAKCAEVKKKIEGRKAAQQTGGYV